MIDPRRVNLISMIAAAVWSALAPVCLADALADPSRAITPAERGFFETKIRPVLVTHCFECHAKDAKKLGGKLRLDDPAALRRGGESGPALTPGRPDESLLIQAMRYEHLEMPPKAKLPDAVLAHFETWVKMGAPDPRPSGGDAETSPAPDDAALWSFQPVKHPPAPSVHDQAWPRDPLDRFVLARMASAGLSPTRDAPPRVLIRRLYFDLIGLPPTHEQIAAFERDHKARGEAATAAVVDTLLASPHFGERWGRHWLDVARYGESNGNDGLSRNPTFPHAWRYRDYVIQAMNEDTPYDRFLTEQIAGDLLPAKGAAQRNRHLVATGFLAIGSKPAKAMNVNFDMDVVDDQIRAVGSGVMGLSVGCARCHDHKHDPIPTRDYYALAGIFKSSQTMWGKAANEKLTAPVTPLHELQVVSKDGDEDEAAKDAGPVEAPAFAKGYHDAVAAQQPTLHFAFAKAAEQQNSEPSQPQAAPSSKLTFEKDASPTDKGYAAFKAGWARGDIATPAPSYSVSFWFRNDTPIDARPVTAYLFSLGPDDSKPAPGDHLGVSGNYKNQGAGKLFIFNGNARSQSVRGKTTIPPNTWNHVVYIRDGKRVTAYLNGETKPEFDGEIDRTSGDATTFLIGARNDKFAPLVGRVAQFAYFDRALTADQAQALHKASGQPRGTAKPKPEAVNQLAMGVRDHDKPADCKININGESKKLGAAVPRGYLTACKLTSPAEPVNPKQSGRLQLARWLTRGDHPQTPRVMVNRIWLHLFGQAIVVTPDDFGAYGARPTHPDLLDHLATRFVSGGWLIKQMIRDIVLSRTYQLSSHADAAAVQADPGNRYYARHLRRRLDAESLRDSMLLVSGQLDRSPGQGSAIQDLDVLVNQQENLHKPSRHRGVYLCMLRNSPPPSLAAFNLPRFVEVTGRRDVTTLPSQALFLLNSPFVIEQSQAMARRMDDEMGDADDAGRIAWAYRRALARPPTPEEASDAVTLIQNVRDSLLDDAQGEGADAEASKHRAWASFCQALLISSEFRYID